MVIFLAMWQTSFNIKKIVGNPEECLPGAPVCEHYAAWENVENRIHAPVQSK